MIDLHCHILDGVDDGSYCLSDSVEMARAALESGTRLIAATPHACAPGLPENPWGEALEQKLAALNAALAAARLDLRVLPGQEIYCDGDILPGLKSGRLIPLNGSRYVLTEFDFYASAEVISDRARSLLAEGWVPVIAHPERYAAVKEDAQNAYRLKRLGCLLQLNSGSLFGDFGNGARNAAHELLGEQLADVIASDAHSPYVRTPFMADAHEMVSELYSLDYADLLFRENPGRIIENKTVGGYF